MIIKIQKQFVFNLVNKFIKNNSSITKVLISASDALNMDHPLMKSRPLSLATKASKVKASRITEVLLPYKPRPQTSVTLARRLVQGALGLKMNIPKSVRDAEKQKLKDAKGKFLKHYKH